MLTEWKKEIHHAQKVELEVFLLLNNKNQKQKENIVRNQLVMKDNEVQQEAKREMERK